MPADDTRKSDFYKNALPELLRPRKFALTIEVEAICNFTEMEALSAQVTLADGDALDMVLADAKEILDELDSFQDYIMEDAQDVGTLLNSQWPYEVIVGVRLDTGADGAPVVESGTD